MRDRKKLPLVYAIETFRKGYSQRRPQADKYELNRVEDAFIKGWNAAEERVRNALIERH